MVYQVVTGVFVNASDINQLARVLQRQSGDQETGKYYLTGSSHAIGAALGALVPSISRGSTPASVSIDTSDQAPSNCGAPATDHLTSSGFRVSTTSTAVATSVQVAGNYTIAY